MIGHTGKAEPGTQDPGPYEDLGPHEDPGS